MEFTVNKIWCYNMFMGIDFLICADTYRYEDCGNLMYKYGKDNWYSRKNIK
jgi:hypothetical protein